MKFKSQIIKDVIGESDIGEVYEGIKLIKNSQFVNDGKYENCYHIIEFEDKFYIVNVSRTGSYYTEYSYDSEYWEEEIDLQEVKKVEKIVYDWVAVK